MEKIHSYLERDENDYFEMRIFYDLAQAVAAFEADVAAGKDVSDLRTEKFYISENGVRL